jgi:hypothetical protein
MVECVKVDPRQMLENQSEPAGHDQRRRWVKVDVPEETFVLLHDMAAQSRMRIQPYLRRFLQEAWPYQSPGDNPGVRTFACDRQPHA